MSMGKTIKTLVFLIIASVILAACQAGTASESDETLVIYSGRSESLVGPIIEQFEETSGINVEVRWAGTPELAATLLEEGENTPADVFFAQDPGGLGAVEEMLTTLPQDLVDKVAPDFRGPDGRWIGVSGRARVVVYNTERLSPDDLPQEIEGFTDPQWRGRIGWAPTNASFQTMVTAMRTMWGEEKTRQWLEGIQVNEPVVYENNSSIVAAVGAGEVDVGFVNHYYLMRFLQEEGEGFAARNYFFPGTGPGSLVMVAGAGILETTDNQDAAVKFLDFLVSPVAQQYFATQTFEYPVVEGVVIPRQLPPLEELSIAPVELAELADLQGSIDLLNEVGILQ